MVAAPYRPQAAPPATFAPMDEGRRLAAALMAAVLPPGGPRRLALMNGPDRERKYSDPPQGHRFTLDDMRAHLRAPGQPGARTWAAALLDAEGLAVAGCRDYDGDNGNGARLALEALDRAQAAGLVAFAILVAGRGHVWPLYRRPAPAADIRAQLAAVLPAGPGEIYPSGNNIRLPLGYHRRALTRGTLVLQDGRRFTLDDPAQLVEGLRAILSLARNAAPPPAPPEGRRKATAGAAPLDPAAWAELPDGAAVMGSSRFQTLFRARPQLRAMAEGRRIVITTDAGADDTGNQQVAVLISNLLTTGRSATLGGPLVPGLGAPPLAEIRAAALHWRDTLRPGYDLDAYKADVDRLIVKYLPQGYQPETTRGLSAARPAAAPVALAAPRGRPAGQRAAQVEQLAELLAKRIGQVVTVAELAGALGVADRMARLYLADLRAAGRLDTARAGHGLRILRSAIKCPAPAEQVAEGAPVEPPPIGNRASAQGAAEGIGAAKIDVGAAQRKNTPPPRPACPAPAAPPAAEPPPWGSDLDRLALAAELLGHNAGYVERARFVVRAIADGALRLAALAVLQLDPVAAPPALLALLAHVATAEALAGLPPAPSATAPSTSRQLGRAELVALESRILDAVAQIRADRVDRLDRSTGEIVTRPARATLARVAALLPDVPPDDLAQGWAFYGDIWGRERRRLATLPPHKLAGAYKAAAKRHARAVAEDDPRVKYFAELAALADRECQRRGLDPLAPAGRRRKAADFATRKAQAAETARRRAALLPLFDAAGDESATTAPALPSWASPPADDTPHPADLEISLPAAGPQVEPAASAVPGMVERLRAIPARPRVELGRPQQPAPAPAQGKGFTVDECDSWWETHGPAMGWRRGPAGQWEPAPAARPVPCAD